MIRALFTYFESSISAPQHQAKDAKHTLVKSMLLTIYITDNSGISLQSIFLITLFSSSLLSNARARISEGSYPMISSCEESKGTSLRGTKWMCFSVAAGSGG